MRHFLSTMIPLAALPLALFLPACSPSGSFSGSGTGVPVEPASVQVIRSKDEVSEPYKEVGTARAKAASAEEAVEIAKGHCGRTGGGDLLIMNTEPFQSGNHWRVDATCARSERPIAAPAGGGGKPTGSGKAIR